MSFLTKVVTSPQFFSYVVCILAITGSTLFALGLRYGDKRIDSTEFDD